MTALSLPLLAQFAVGSVAGVALGFTHFMALRWNVRLFEHGATPRAILVLLGRFAILAVALAALAKLGALALLAGAAGLLVARRIVLRRYGGLR